MKISIHQPQYLPWIHYFKKILISDIFIFLDNVQYQKNSLINRNQLYNNRNFWLTIPIKSPSNKKICEVKIDNSKNWKKKHLDTIKNIYSKKINFQFFLEYLLPIYSKNYEYLADFNIELIQSILKNYFKKNIKIYRQKNIITNEKGSKLIVEICKYFGANFYISGKGGKNYLDEDSFLLNNINLQYLDYNFLNEKKLKDNYIFKPELSALDLILNIKHDFDDYIK